MTWIDVRRLLGELDDVDDSDTTDGYVVTRQADGTFALEELPVSGATDFTGLSDTPGNYTGSAGQYVAVNAGATALEFVDVDTDRYEVIVDGTGPPVAVTNEDEDDWIYGKVSD